MKKILPHNLLSATAATRYFNLLLFLLPIASFAQDSLMYMKPPAGKARIVVMYDNYDPRQRVINLYKAPFFINQQLVCRFSDGTYTWFDVEPGTCLLAAEKPSKKPGKKNFETELRATEGELYYFELEGVYEGLRSVVYVRKMHPVEFEKLVERRRTKFTKNCNLAKQAKADAAVNKRVFIRVPIGFSMPADNYVSWWPRELQPSINRFQPLMAGFEIGVKLGEKNIFFSWEFANNRQQQVSNIATPGLREYISINYNTLYYAYGFALNAGNTCLLYPKAGLSLLNYVLESRGETGGGSQGVSGIGMAVGSNFEYRINRTFSLDASLDYLHGKINFKQEAKKLNQLRLFTGVRVRF